MLHICSTKESLQEKEDEKVNISTTAIYHLATTNEVFEKRDLGILNPLLEDLAVTDILVNGHKEIWIDKGQGLEKTKLKFLSEENVRTFAQKIALSTGRRLDQSQHLCHFCCSAFVEHL